MVMNCFRKRERTVERIIRSYLRDRHVAIDNVYVGVINSPQDMRIGIYENTRSKKNINRILSVLEGLKRRLKKTRTAMSDYAEYKIKLVDRALGDRRYQDDEVVKIITF